MAVWMIRAGKHGEDEDAALESGHAIVGWGAIPDLSAVNTYEQMKSLHGEVYPEKLPRAIQNNAAQLWAFVHKIKIGDIAVLPLKTRSYVAVGRVTGDYQFKDGRHMRKVDWVRPEIPRTDFGQDLLYSMGAFMTICRIQRNKAEERFAAILAGERDPGLKGQVGGHKEADTADDVTLVDLEEQAYDQIRLMIESRFKGHELARLVEAILKAQGYQTFRSPAGPDGGVDILAGAGVMGFDRPRICVQVKSGGAQSDTAIRKLEGVMSRMSAEQGLFVSWDGFNATALKGTRDLFFKVRLWDDRKLIDNLLANYELMPDDLQAELPLKRIWVVVPEE